MTYSPSHFVICPLCMGDGELSKARLAARWNDREMQRTLAQYADEYTAGEDGGIDNPFESKEEANARSTAEFHSCGAGVPKE